MECAHEQIHSVTLYRGPWENVQCIIAILVLYTETWISACNYEAVAHLVCSQRYIILVEFAISLPLGRLT